MNARQQKILDLIQSQRITTQGELVSLLNEAGFDVTQATISRDISALNLTKKPQGGGYVVAPRIVNEAQARYAKLFKESVLTIKLAQNILVLKTMPGSAQAAGALLDSLNYPEILGSVAGDDTIIAVVDNEIKAKRVMETLRVLLL